MVTIRYPSLAGRDTFIGQYMTYMQDVETATDYDFWSALWLLSCAVSRDVFVDRPRIPVFLNLYTIFVAESGITRKSTAVVSARRICTDLYADDPTIDLIEGKTTTEQLEKLLHERSTITGSSKLSIAISELGTFLGTERYNSGLPILLTDLYDCPDERNAGGTVTRGSVKQHRVWLNLISASTPAWLFKSVNPNIVAGGFTSRCIFVISERPKSRISWPTNRRGDNGPLTSSLRLIRERGRNVRRIDLNETARRSLDKWYKGRVISLDAFKSSFESREDDHVLRIAALLCINDGAWLVQDTHIKTAIRIIGKVKEDAANLFNGTSTRSRLATGLDRLYVTFLKVGTGTITRAELYLRVRAVLDADEFNSLIAVLLEIEAVQAFEIKQDGRGRPTTVYRGTQLLKKSSTLKDIIERVGT